MINDTLSIISRCQFITPLVRYSNFLPQRPGGTERSSNLPTKDVSANGLAVFAALCRVDL